MALTTPVIDAPIAPFPSDEEFVLKFSVSGGDQVVKNRVLIERVSDNEEKYNEEEETFKFKHTIPANTLENGEQYRVKVRTYNSEDDESEWSDSVLFYCFSEPTIEIVNIEDEKVNSSSYEFEAEYTQSEEEEPESYRFYLYDNNEVMIRASTEQYDFEEESNVFKCSHTFSSLQDNVKYYVEVQMFTENGMQASSGLYGFYADYVSPIFHTAIQLENIPDQASVKVNMNILDIEGELYEGSKSYEEGSWINLHDGTVVFDEGFDISKNFSMRFWCKDIVDEDLIELVDIYGKKILIQYKNNGFYVFKIVDDYSHYMVYEEIELESDDVVCVRVQQIGDLINLETELVS